MDEALKMMTEFILEENVSQKEEIRLLKEQTEKLKSENDYAHDRLGRFMSDRSQVYKVLSQYARWENGKLQSISIYNSDALETLRKVMELYEQPKATL